MKILMPNMPRFAARALGAALLILLLLAAGGCRRKRYENPITKDTQQPDKILFDKAIADIERGRYEIARLTLQTLMNTYDTSEFLAKSKLAIADSWYREGGTAAWANAEAEYKDFILFYPTLEESAEAQWKICGLHYRQMEKPDRDPGQVLRAEEECRQVLTQFPNSRYAPQATGMLRKIQEVVAESEYRVGSFYYQKGGRSLVAAANRFENLTNHFPLYSQAPDALMKLGDAYSKLGNRFRDRTVAAFQKVVREYPLAPEVDEAKKRLGALEAEIPAADPVALARMQYEQENATPRGTMGRMMGIFSKSPDTSNAAKSGQPAATSLRPTSPLTIPGVLDASQTTTTDVTVSPAGGDTTALDTQPDARLAPPKSAETKPIETSAADPKKNNNSKKKKK